MQTLHLETRDLGLSVAFRVSDRGGLNIFLSSIVVSQKLSLLEK